MFVWGSPKTPGTIVLILGSNGPILGKLHFQASMSCHVSKVDRSLGSFGLAGTNGALVHY
jgi:hypothetical protein